MNVRALALIPTVLLGCGMPVQSQDEDRLATIRPRVEPALREKCQAAGLTYPPGGLFLRAFKAERMVEAWGSDDAGSFRLIATWPVLAASGEPGPKRREGDLQVPEGCYRVVIYNPLSKFHLSLGLDYPNESDRVRSDPDAPGFDIYIHGGDISKGCLATGDEAIEEIYLLAKDTFDRTGSSVAIHIFPVRMAGPAWENARTAHPELAAFWSELEPIYAAFERTRRVPLVSIAPTGEYRLTSRAP